ncbi:MAG: nucleotidyl transferase AbiEii/AbiGii toxin family protein [Nanoarchaeota archaeon]
MKKSAVVFSFSIYSHIGKELVFKGGTCLYKIHKLNRFSEDLDFTLTKRFDVRKLIDFITTDFKLLNINCKIKEIKEYQKEINVRLLFNGPLYKRSKETQCFIPLNISLREQVEEAEKSSIYSFYREIPNFEVFSISEREILAEKVRAIFTRQKPRDIYDLFFLLMEKNMEIDKNIIDKKLKLYNIDFEYRKFLDRIGMMKGLWESDLKNLVIGTLPLFNNIKKYLHEKFLVLKS